MKTRKLFSARPRPPSEPGLAPIHRWISSGCAGRNTDAPVAVCSLASFSWSSPRTMAATGFSSAT